MYFRVKRVQIVVRTHQDLRRLQLLRPVVQARVQPMRVSHKSVVKGARPRYLLSFVSHVFHTVKPLQKDLIQTTAKVCMDIITWGLWACRTTGLISGERPIASALLSAGMRSPVWNGWVG